MSSSPRQDPRIEPRIGTGDEPRNGIDRATGSPGREASGDPAGGPRSEDLEAATPQDGASDPECPPLLDVRGLTLDLPTRERGRGGAGADTVRILDGVGLRAYPGQATALVGSSGSGKTWTARSILGLWTEGARLGGEIRLAGHGDLVSMEDSERRRLRGREMAMVFQEPLSAFHPLLRIGTQIAEVSRLRAGSSRRQARQAGLEMLARVALPDPEAAWDAYPHQLSGGQRQRAMLAMALAGGPKLLLADEPTTALDATVQAQVLDLLEDLGKELDLALVLITHDLAVVARICRHLVVIDTGRTVEAGPLRRIYAEPSHPTTRRLLEAAWAPSPGAVP